jgi:hypothetical protein
MYGQGKVYNTKKGRVYQRRYACKKWDRDGSRIGCCTVFRIADAVEQYVTEQVLFRFDSVLGFLVAGAGANGWKYFAITAGAVSIVSAGGYLLKTHREERRHFRSAILVLTVGILALSVGIFKPTEADPKEGVLPKFSLKNGGRCLQASDASGNNATPTQLASCNNSPGQLWEVERPEIRTTDHICLDVRGPSSLNGTVVQIWDCNGAAEMKLEVKGSSIVGFEAKCLDARAARSGDAPVQIWDCDGTPGQEWTLLRAKK